MARVAITEFAAKKLVFGDEYVGVSLTPQSTEADLSSLPNSGTFVVKVDVGIKKRGKQGLLRLNVAKNKIISAATELFALGHARCVVEPMVAHETTDERYLSLDLVRDGALLIISDKGGVDIEDANDSDIKRMVIPRSEVLRGTTTTEVNSAPLPHFLQQMHEYHFSFLEINPYIVSDSGFQALDMAVEIDSTKEGKLPAWAHEHVLHKRGATEEEQAVLEQDARTQAALNLHILNENGSILTLFSGGGASLVALDSLVTAGIQDKVINYSEYSGAPTRDETEAYVSTLLHVLFKSTAQNKVILIAGGVANFTDVMATFQGIVNAFEANIKEIQKQRICVCVRRGGPNQESGLQYLKMFLVKHNIEHDVHDPSLSLGEVGNVVRTHI